MATIKEIEVKIKESNEVFDDVYGELRSLFVEGVKNHQQYEVAQDLIHKMGDVQTELTSLHEDLYLAQMRELSRQDELED